MSDEKTINNGVEKNPKRVSMSSFGNLEESRFNDHFTYHKPNDDQIPRYSAINEAAKNFAEVICHNLPDSADKNAALRKLVEVKMTCNSFIATNPDLYKEQ